MESTNLDILIEAEDFVVFDKPYGVDCEKSLPQGLFLIHRLDKTTAGCWLCAKNKGAAAKLSNLIKNGEFIKRYMAKIQPGFSPKEGLLEDYLYHDRFKNKTYVVKKRQGSKLAKLEYKMLDDETVEIKLLTGRTHQIRVQFASRGYPLLGDRKYGSKIERKNIALLCYEISFLNFSIKTKIPLE